MKSLMNSNRIRKLLLLKTLLIGLSFTIFSAQAESIFQTKDLALVETADESADDIKQLVRKIGAAQGKPRSAREIGDQIFGLMSAGNEISHYDYVWTLYSLIVATRPELDGGMSVKDYLKVTDTAMYYLDQNGVGDWVFTDVGQFQMEVYRQAANSAAWTLREANPKKALAYIEAGLAYMRDEDLWMQDTKVRVLLNLNKKDEAYAIVKAVLAESPEFDDFKDFKIDERYSAWLKTN